MEDFEKKTQKKMIDIQIELSNNRKGSGDIFDKTKDFIQHISDKVREIHRKNFKIEDFVVIFTDSMVCVQIQLEYY